MFEFFFRIYPKEHDYFPWKVIHTSSTRVTSHSLPFSCPLLGASLSVLWLDCHTVACGQCFVNHQDSEFIG